MVRTILSLIALMLLLVSCGHTRYVPVDRVRTELRDVIKHRIDSVHLIDSIYVHTKGDTVYQTRWRTMLRERKIIDTVHHYRTDTITQVVEVPAQPTIIQRMEYYGYRIVFFASVLLALLYVIRKQLWRKQ